MKKSLLILGGMLGLLVGCASTESEENHAVADKKLKYYFVGSTNDLVKQELEAFTKDYGDWEIDLEFLPREADLAERLITDKVNNTYPDLVYCDPSTLATYEADLLDVTTYIKDKEIGYTDAEIADFLPNSLLDLHYLPLTKKTSVMYYNKEALEFLVNKGYLEANDVANLANLNWEDIWNIKDKLKNTPYKEWEMVAIDSFPLSFLEMAAASDSLFGTNGDFALNNQTNIDLITNLRTQRNNGDLLVSPLDGNYLSNAVGYFNPDSPTSATLFSIGSVNSASYFNDPDLVGMTAIPQVNGKRAIILQGQSLAMFDNHDEEGAKITWKFIKALEDPEFQASYAINLNSIPCRLSSLENTFYASWLNSDNPYARANKASLIDIEAFVNLSVENEYSSLISSLLNNVEALFTAGNIADILGSLVA